MKLENLSIEKLNKELSSEFREISGKLANLLRIEKIDTSITIEMQNPQSDEKSPLNVDTFGIYSSQGNKIVISKIYFSANKRLFRSILSFVLAREAIRRYLTRELSPSNNYSRLFFILNNVLATLWIAQDNKITSFQNPKLRIIRSSTSFQDDQLFKTNEWDSYLLQLFKNKTPLLSIVLKFKYFLTLAHEKNWTQTELTNKFCSWIDVAIIEDDFLALPLFMTDRHFQITNMLVESGMANSSAIKIGKKFGLKHDVINSAFLEMYDTYNFYWRPNINFLLLKLYPYYFRITLEKKYKSMILEKLKSVPYITTVYEGISDDKSIISCLIPCPHIVQNQLEEYFESLKNKEFIHDYFFQLLKGRTLQSSITTQKIKQSISTFEQLIKNPQKFSFQTIKLLDENFDYSNPSIKKKAVFDENVLHFISALRTKTLQKGVYMCYPAEMDELCLRNGRSVKDIYSIVDFINQMDIRCRRLGLYDYFLSIQKLALYKQALCIELHSSSTSEIQEYLEKLKFTSNMIYLNFYDRVLVIFPRIGLQHPFTKVVEKLTRKAGFDYILYSNLRNADLYRYIPYHELYDFELNKWKH